MPYHAPDITTSDRSRCIFCHLMAPPLQDMQSGLVQIPAIQLKDSQAGAQEG